MKRRSVNWILGVVAAVAVTAGFCFVMDETQVGVVTQFGRPVRTVTRPGLYLKLPIQSVVRFDRRLQIYNPRASELLTSDKKNLVVENYVAWRVGDPERFLTAVRTPAGSYGVAVIDLAEQRSWVVFEGSDVRN
ncbi:MAG: SPFH domain-containing protein, partial [Armatimonadota bacterium]|nr:SPFH domain-containing protein [Armatimonadota bacterium]